MIQKTTRRVVEQEDVEGGLGRQEPISRRLAKQNRELECLVEVRTAELTELVRKMEQIQAQLIRSEMRFRALVESTSDWVWEVDDQARYTYSSPGITDMLGYTPDEVLGKTPFELMPAPEVARKADVFWRHAADRAALVQLQNTNLHRDGHEVVLETSGVPIIGDHGELLGYRGIDRDITRRIQADDTLREQERMLAYFANSSRIAFWVRDAVNDQFLFLSPAYELIWGDPVENLYRDPSRFAESIHHDDRERVMSAIREKHDIGGFDQEYRIVRVDGQERWVHVSTYPVGALQGDGYHIVSCAMDITDRKHADQTWRLHEQQLRKTLVREIHHQTKNNLQGIIGLLRQQLGDHEGLDKVANQVISQIQSISLIYELQGCAKRLYLQGIVEAIGHSVSDLFAAAGLFDIDSARSQPYLLSEKEAVPIALVVNELLINAAKHGLKGAPIHIVLDDDGERLTMSVRNMLVENRKMAGVEGKIVKGQGIELVRALLAYDGVSIDFRHSGDAFEAVLRLDRTVCATGPTD